MANILAALIDVLIGWWTKRKAAADRDKAIDAEAAATVDSAAINQTTEVKLDESRKQSEADIAAIRMPPDGSAGGTAPAGNSGVLRKRAIVNEAINRANSGGDL